MRGVRRSDAAIRAATTKQTVVKKPKTFWARTIVECMVRGLFSGEELGGKHVLL